MSVRRLRKASPTPAVEIVVAHCDLCINRGTCASINAGATTLCFLCAVSTSQLIASVLTATKRPDPRPCTCEACVRFDEGQRGEIANLVLLERPVEQTASDDAGDGGDDPPPSSASGSAAEVSRPARPHPEPCTCDECRGWTHEVKPSRFSWMEVD